MSGEKKEYIYIYICMKYIITCYITRIMKIKVITQQSHLKTAILINSTKNSIRMSHKNIHKTQMKSHKI